MVIQMGLSIAQAYPSPSCHVRRRSRKEPTPSSTQCDFLTFLGTKNDTTGGHWGAKRTNWKGGVGSKGRTEHAGNIKKPFFSPQPSKSRAFLKFCVKHPKTISSKFGALSKCSHSGQFWRSVAITTTQSYGKSPRHLIDLFFGSSNSQREVSGKDKMTNRLSTNLPSGNLRYLK